MKFTADAVAQSEVVEAGAEIRITAAEEFRMALNERDLAAALKAMGERPRRFRIAFTSAPPQTGPAPRPAGAAENEAMRRALTHPEVERFREEFPDSAVRVARNLKE